MRIYWKLLGGHYHLHLFLNGKLGDLCIGKDDWEVFKQCFSSFTTWIEEEDKPLTKEQQDEDNRIFDAYLGR